MLDQIASLEEKRLQSHPSSLMTEWIFNTFNFNRGLLSAKGTQNDGFSLGERVSGLVLKPQ